jgi:ribonuclease Z
MNIRNYQLNLLNLEGMTLAGYSVGGEESVIVMPELDCAFDIGKCPREALRVNHVLLSHGHMDHAAGVAYWFSQRDFLGIEGGELLVAESLVGPLENLMAAVAAVEGHPSPCKFVGMLDGQDHEIRRGLFARAFATRHVGSSLGFTLIEVRQKLREEFADKTGPELVALKKKGVEITRRVEIPLVSYLGDTARDRYCAKLPHVREAKVLLLECTFFDPDHLQRARSGRHLHVTDLAEVLEGSNNQHVVLIHVTRRTNLAQARKILRRTLPKEIFPKVSFLMSRQQVEAEE